MKHMSSFERGFCRALDLGARNKNILGRTIRRNDKQALAKDWENVGQYITTAARKYGENIYRR